jgi:hypothetical protein
MNALPWAYWPELQKQRVRKEVALRLGTGDIDKRKDIIVESLYELYPYANEDDDYRQLVIDIHNDIRSRRHAL